MSKNYHSATYGLQNITKMKELEAGWRKNPSNSHDISSNDVK